MPETLARPNRYAATCVRCRGHIPAGDGLLVRTDDGKWAADHPAECPAKPMAIAEPREAVNRDGIYRTADGTIYKVQIAKQGSGRLYAKQLHVTDNGDGTHTGTFAYAAGAIHNLHADERMTDEQARAFGQLYGICCACGADLTDENSIARGIGPVCGAKYF